MSNIAKLLKEEITRLARKEVRSETVALKKAVARYRGEIAALKRQVAALQRNHTVRPARAMPVRAATAPEGETTLRFRADGFKKHRTRLGLSAPAMAGLLGVSPQTIYNWESGTSRPGKDQVVKIARLRKMGKRDVRQHLAAMKSAA